MALKELDHVVLLVRDIEKGVETWTRLGLSLSHRVNNPDNGVAIAFFISVCTFGVNEEMSPSSKRDNATTLIAGGEGGGGEGGGGEGEGGGGEGGGGTAGNATTSGNATSRRRSMIPRLSGSVS